MTLRWGAYLGGFTAWAGPTRRFCIDVSHRCSGTWFATERTFPGGALVSGATFDSPTAQLDARLWCEERAKTR